MYLKLVSIRDVGFKFEIPNKGMARGPINKILLDNDQIRRILHMHGGPKNLFFVDPRNENNVIKITEDNYYLDESELFPAPVVINEIAPAAKDNFTLDYVTECKDESSPIDIIPETDETATEYVEPIAESIPSDDFISNCTDDSENSPKENDEAAVVEDSGVNQVTDVDVAPKVVTQKTYNNSKKYSYNKK